MAQHKNSSSSNCGGAVIMAGVVIYLLMRYPYPVLGILILCFVGVLFTPTKCEICKNPLGRNKYEWILGGKRQRVCAHCNQSLQRKNSRDAMKGVK